ncbi:MAG: SPOR domain-containing protein [Cytophagaceae bacterium]
MNIERYIKELLDNQDCVIIPGWGALLVQTISAEIHPITHKFLPPGKTLGFNSQVKVNDGLLASFIAVEESITFSEAIQSINQWVQMVNNNLKTSKSHAIDQIGRFFMNDSGSVEFVPEMRSFVTSDTFGLPELVFKPIERTPKPMESTRKTQSKKTEDSNKEKEETSGNGAWKVIAFVAPVFILLGAGLFLMKQNPEIQVAGYNFDSLFGSETVIQTEENQAIEEVVLNNIDSVNSVVETEDNVMEMNMEQPVSDASLSQVSSGNFSIVIGAFKEESNATKLTSSLQAKGYDVVKHDVDSKGFYMVTVGDFDSKESAKEKRKDFVSDLGESIWIKKF